MAYHLSGSRPGFGFPGCGSGCRCRSCLGAYAALGEHYIPGAFGEPPQLRLPGPQLQLPRPRIGVSIPRLRFGPLPRVPVARTREAIRAADPCLAPRSPEEELNCRIQRILREPIPPPRPGRSFDELFWGLLDRNLDRAMGLASVPKSWRGAIWRAAREGLQRGARAALDAVLERAGIGSTGREAIRAAISAALQSRVF